MTGTPSQPSIRRMRVTGRMAIAIGAVLMTAAFLLPGFAPPAEADQEDRCTQYYFLYTDGHTDQGEVCDGPVNELRSGTHGIHVPSLHISCSDAFDTWVEPDGDEPGGWGSDGNSDLGGHLIADIDGVAQWGVRKSWTGGDDCGLVAPPPPSTPDPANPVAALAFDCDEGLYVTASNDGDEDATLSVWQGEDLLETIDVPAGTLAAVTYPIDGEEIAEDGSADFSVTFGEQTLDARTVEKDCEPPITVNEPDPTPSVDVEKLVSLDGVSYEDADTGTGPTFTLGLGETQSAWFRVIVTNTSGDGTVLTLNSIDDEITSGDAPAIDLSDCTFPNGGLEDGDSVTCNVGPVATQTGLQHTNLVTVSATGAEQTVGDSDPANYLGEAQVGGIVTERPEPAPEPAPEPDVVAEPDPEPDPEPAPEVLGEELPRTGPEDLWLAGFALMLIGGGLLMLGRGTAMDVPAFTAGTWSMHHLP